MPPKRKAAPLVDLTSTSSAMASAIGGNGSAPSAVISGSETSTVWKSMTVLQLKNELRDRQMPLSGKKADLVGRLEAAEGGPSASIPTSGLSAAAAPAPRRKRARKQVQATEAGQDENDVLMNNDTDPTNNITSHDEGPNGEKRLRPFVEIPHANYKNQLKAVRTQRMFMIDRQRTSDSNGYVSEKFDIAGSTGNIYQVTIARKPNCTCMDARIRGQRCKHIKYALIIILKAPQKLCYQDAFLSTELERMFANAPITRGPDAHDHNQVEDESLYNGKRKPIEGECPICVFGMEPDEEIVWCKAACGQNFHKECFDQWKRSMNGRQVTCVYCRSPWQEGFSSSNSLAGLKDIAPRLGRYQNVAHIMPQYQDQGYDE